jgi:hypothetical protein
MDRHDRVAPIVLAAEHPLDFGRFDLVLEIVEAFGEVRADLFAGLRPLQQDAEVIAAALERGRQADLFFETTAALEHALCFGLVLPEVRIGSTGLEPAQLVSRACTLKDSSACRRSVSSDPDSA